ncbi:MAG: arylsulfatase [Opitutales bacterium]|nr:arylsulfatase [Opitutales bacterium]
MKFTQFLLLVSILAFTKLIAKPNIIVIYADDVGYGDIGCYGATAIDTPNLDRLANEGIRFTSAYATASTCTPSRFSLLTGLYPFRNRDAVILPGNAPLIIDINKPNLPNTLRDNGYATALVGKWHIGLGVSTEPLDWNGEISPGPREVGFDYSFHMAATGDRVPSVYIENGRIVNLDANDPITVSYQEQVGDDPTGISHPHLLKVQADEQHAKTIVDGVSRIGTMSGGHAARWKDEEMSDTFLQKALDYIETQKNKPFFLYYATQENHVPRIPHPRFVGSTSLGVRGDAVAQMDWNIGKIIDHLDNLGILENTLIIFSSDNGPVLFDGYWDGAIERNGNHRAAGPFAGGKYSVNEGGTRMPFIVYWKGKILPEISDALISQVDLFASLTKIAGIDANLEGTDGEDLSRLLLGESNKGRDYLVQQGVGNKALRMGDWKYIPEGVITNRGRIGKFVREEVTTPGQLFFLPEDPMEQNDLAASYPEKVKEMKTLLLAELGETASLSSGTELGGAVDE